MENKNNVHVNGGIGFMGLLQIVFIVLKLVKVINWSWVWVLCPIWIPLLLTLILLLIMWVAFIIARRN